MPAPEVLAVNPELSPEQQRIFDNTPEDESRSRLEPYRELILLWRRRGRSYRRICRSLQEQCGCSVAHSTLRRFVQRHYRPRKGQPEVQAEEPITTPAVPEQTAARPRLSLEERIAQRDAIRAAFNKPAVPHEEPKKRFVFDPDKPITKNY
jgi:hypothetical protein